MALIDRIRRLFSPGQAVEIYTGGLPYGMVGPWGRLGLGGIPLPHGSVEYLQRFNGLMGQSLGVWDGTGRSAFKDAYRMPVSELYACQPHLQTVVAFRARNIAQLPLHAYRVKDEKHERDTGPVSRLLHRPNGWQTGFELVRNLVTCLDLWGEAYWVVTPSADTPSGWSIMQVPPEWVEPDGETWHQPKQWKITSEAGREVVVPAENMVVFRGPSPDGLGAVSPVAALREILAEQMAAWEYRAQSWTRGARAAAYVTRPAGAPEWTDAARDRFTEEWHEFAANGARSGETPVLEDGMDVKRVGFSAREDEWSEVARLSLKTVCSVYHVPPAMVGAEGTTTYASAREFRSMLYTETLGPIIREIEQRINEFVLPIVAPGDPDLRVKFNIDAKLAGSFEEQASVLSTATGAPWMTVNEARALRNLPPLPDGDQLVVPLNVTQGGQASPQSGQAPSVAVQNAIQAGNEGEVEVEDGGEDT